MKGKENMEIEQELLTREQRLEGAKKCVCGRCRPSGFSLYKVIRPNDLNGVMTINDSGFYWSIQCDFCGRETKIFSTKQKALGAWNNDEAYM